MSIRRQDARTANALLFAEYEQRWRGWRGIVAEEQAKLAQRQEQTSFADSLDAPLDGPAPLPQARVAPALRKEIGAILEVRCSEAMQQATTAARAQGGALPDADQVYAALLTQIAAELEGRVHPQGRALLYHDGQLLEFDHHAVEAASADDFLVARPAARLNPLQRWSLGVLGVLVILGVLAWVVVPRTSPADAAPATEATVGNQTIPLWDATTLVAAGQEYQISFAQPGWPLKVCVPAATTAVLQVGTPFTITGATSVRTYTVAAGVTTPDVLVAQCAA